MPSIQNIKAWYIASFSDVLGASAPTTHEREREFMRVLESIFARHGRTMALLGRGLHELKREADKCDVDLLHDESIQKALDEFYMARIGVRMVVGGIVEDEFCPS